MGTADLNIVLDPVYGLETAKLLEKKHAIPYLCAEGLPVGFHAMEELISRVCRLLGCDETAFLMESEKARARAYIHLSRVNSLTGLPKGARFAVHGTSSQCLGFVRFLLHYFGMVADAVALLDHGPDYDALCRLLDEHGMGRALEKDILETDAEIVFADGNIIAMLKARNHPFSGVEINLPTLGYIDVVPKTHLGLSGGLLLCEQIINGLQY